MDKIKIEVSTKYRENLDYLKEMISKNNGIEIKEDNELIEMLIIGFSKIVKEESDMMENDKNDHNDCKDCECDHN